MKNLGEMMEQVRRMQENMQRAQEELAQAAVTGVAGGGMVRIVLSGKGGMKSVEIDPSLLAPEEGEILEDLLIAAHNDARAKVEELTAEKMREAAGGLPLPPGMDMPF